MADIKVTLIHGLKIGEHVYKKAVLREATAGDVIESHEESEKLVMVPDENARLHPEFVASPTLIGVNVLRRQIKKIDEHHGPLQLDELKSLHPYDLNLLQVEANKMDAAAEKVAEELAARGRSKPSGDNA